MLFKITCGNTYGTIKRLDQGHLHPTLEVLGLMSRPGIELGPLRSVGGAHPRKKPFEQLVNSYSEHLHMSPRHGSPQCMSYMNIHEMHKDVG